MRSQIVYRRSATSIAAALGVTLLASPASAQVAASRIDAGDTAWMISATGLVLMMTIPGLALFYCGMVRKKNVLATMAQSLACVGLCSILWFAVGYSLSFAGDGAWLGTFEKAFMRGTSMEATSAFAPTIPEVLFMFYQMTFAIITVALVAGSVADRMRFSAFLWFAAGWLLLVYVPIAHWVWGGGFLAKAGVLDFAGGTVVHLNAGIAGLVACYVVGKRHGYGSENFAPYDLSLAVIGTGLLWVGWLGFNGGSALGANSRAAFAITATHLAAAAGALTWMFLEWWTRGKPSVLGMISGAIAGLGTITPASGFVLPWHGLVIGLIAGAICYWGCTWLKLRLWLRQFARRVRRPRHRRCDRHLAGRRVRGRRLVGHPGFAGRIAWPDRRQCAAASGPALCHRRHRRLVGCADLRPAQGDRVPGPAAGKPSERDRRSRHHPARRGAAVGTPRRTRSPDEAQRNPGPFPRRRETPAQAGPLNSPARSMMG